jgi:hypothetical protein
VWGAGPIPDALAAGHKALARVSLSIRSEADVTERLRNAVWHLGHGLTMTSVIEDAMSVPRPGRLAGSALGR